MICDIGNFTKVKLLKKPKYRACMENPYLQKKIILFADDTIMKLTRWPVCNNLTKEQYVNWSQDYRKGEGKRLWNYAFDNKVQSDWKQNGGCVVIPQCSQCTTFGCRRHIKENIQQENWPVKLQFHHTCGSDKDSYCALLSSHQMIIHQFLKTQSMQQLKLRDDQMVADVMNQIKE